jgi:hypothetical protein
MVARASVLSAETLTILRNHRPLEPFFHNGAEAEAFEAKYRRGPLRVYPRTDGRHIVVDARRPAGERTVAVEVKAEEAYEALNRIADAEGIPWDEEAGGPWVPGGRP